MASRLRLPDLCGIRVEHISDADADLASFLSDCTPARLKLLNVNWYAKNNTGIKSKFYIKTFSEAAARTTKKIFFYCIDFGAEDLQSIVRAGCNAERIVLNFCCIHCCPGLDFGADRRYITKFLSFQYWGEMSYKERKTDWKTDPSKFSLIVDAIGNSGLKASLEKLNIAYNITLPKSKVQEELNEKSMSHISVVRDYVFPLTS